MVGCFGSVQANQSSNMVLNKQSDRTCSSKLKETNATNVKKS